MANPLNNKDSVHGKFFEPLHGPYLDSEHQYRCTGIGDMDYARLGVLRCITPAGTGHGFLQNHGLETGEFHDGGHFCKALQSARRLANLKSINARLGGPSGGAFARRLRPLPRTRGLRYLRGRQPLPPGRQFRPGG